MGWFWGAWFPVVALEARDPALFFQVFSEILEYVSRVLLIIEKTSEMGIDFMLVRLYSWFRQRGRWFLFF